MRGDLLLLYFPLRVGTTFAPLTTSLEGCTLHHKGIALQAMLLNLPHTEGVAPSNSDTAFQAKGFLSSAWILSRRHFNFGH